MLPRIALSAVALCAFPLAALAHPGHETAAGSVASGLAHPLLGIDHVLAIVAVGLWSALLGGRSSWTPPFAFLLCMGGGFALAIAGISLPMVEPGIAASVLVFGALMAAAVRLPIAPSMLLVGLFAVLHGHAHGAEVTGGAVTFGLGFAVSTLILQGAGMGLGHAVGGRLALARGLGGVVAGVGLVLLGGFS